MFNFNNKFWYILLYQPVDEEEEFKMNLNFLSDTQEPQGMGQHPN